MVTKFCLTAFVFEWGFRFFSNILAAIFHPLEAKLSKSTLRDTDTSKENVTTILKCVEGVDDTELYGKVWYQ